MRLLSIARGILLASSVAAAACEDAAEEDTAARRRASTDTAESTARPPGTPGDAGAAPGAPAATVARSAMSFFVTSTGNPNGNLSGLAGADLKCQTLASAGGAGHRTWHAYLSAPKTEAAPDVHAKDRIGPGPWQNKAGTVLAKDVAELHADGYSPPDAAMTDENGAPVPSDARGIYTGTNTDGTLSPESCAGWTSADPKKQARIGDVSASTNPKLGARWNDTLVVTDCGETAEALEGAKGRLYCFAID